MPAKAPKELRITARFGQCRVNAVQSGGRFFVGPQPLEFVSDPESIRKFREAVWRLEEVTGWDCNGGQSNLVAALSADWEPAHIFVAMNLKQLEAYARGRTAYFRDAGRCLWDVMQMMYAQRN